MYIVVPHSRLKELAVHRAGHPVKLGSYATFNRVQVRRLNALLKRMSSYTQRTLLSMRNLLSEW